MREKVDGLEVVAGFVRGKSSSDSISKAYANEFGSITTGRLSTGKESNIPSRPFMQQSLPKMRENIANVVIGIKAKNLDYKLAQIGDVMAYSIEQSIWTGNFVENAPYTLARKNGDTPLVDTGAMVNDITHEVRRAK
jgi:hypothetical protein